jgi:hypothetical protein
MTIKAGSLSRWGRRVSQRIAPAHFGYRLPLFLIGVLALGLMALLPVVIMSVFGEITSPPRTASTAWPRPTRPLSQHAAPCAWI